MRELKKQGKTSAGRGSFALTILGENDFAGFKKK
jgi:hypothetical protein